MAEPHANGTFRVEVPPPFEGFFLNGASCSHENAVQKDDQAAMQGRYGAEETGYHCSKGVLQPRSIRDAGKQRNPGTRWSVLTVVGI